MKLVVHELKTVLSQKINLDRNHFLEAVRPHLYRHSWPAGSLSMQILESGLVLVESEPVAISAIGTAEFFHGHVRFLMNAGLKRGVEYEMRLLADGYSFGEEAYIGWCNRFDEVDLHYAQAPLDLELFERTAK